MIPVCIGSSGINIGVSFNKLLCLEHHIDLSTLQIQPNGFKNPPPEPYFSEVVSNGSGPSQYLSNSIFIDLNSQSIDAVKNSEIGKLFGGGDSMVCPTTCFPSTNICVESLYNCPEELIENISDCFRKISEKVDRLESFLFIHSSTGGAGSGLAQKIIEMVYDRYYYRKLVSNLTIFPDSSSSTNILELYNVIHLIPRLVELSNCTFLVENQKLQQLSQQRFCSFTQRKGYNAINSIICDYLSLITSPNRDTPNLGINLRKIVTNLVPFPRLHFFMGSYISSKRVGLGSFNKMIESDLLNSIFDTENGLSTRNTNSEYIITGMPFFRGEINPGYMDDELKRMHFDHSNNLIDFIPHGLSPYFSVGKKWEHQALQEAGVVLNSTAMQPMLNNLCKKYEKMFKKKAFFSWFSGIGIDREEFQTQFHEVEDLCSEYTVYHNLMHEEEEEEGEFEDEEGD